MIKGIVCIGANGVMGKDGSMPWGDKPLDGKHFRRLTEGHIVVMGRKTFESMGSKPLPNRMNVVMTKRYGLDNVELKDMVFSAHSINDVHWLNETTRPGVDVWIIGGAEVFKQFMPYIEEMYVTTVGESFEGDTYFPDMHADYMWDSELLGIENKLNFTLHYRKFTRKRDSKS